MIGRPFWWNRIRAAWDAAPVAWLTGVRRVGKTTIAQAIPDSLYLNCDLPSSARRLRDPERFYASVDRPVVILDEVHQLPDPSRILKIGADVHPELKILATGSSTLAATRKFRDSLTGRKRTVHLLGVLHAELPAFGVRDLGIRLLRGGLPEPLLEPARDPEFYSEWLDSYFARDVQELFRVGKRQEYLQLIELVLRNSGRLLEVTTLAKHCRLSRPTVMSYLDILQITHVLHLVRPFHAGGRREVLRQPKAYGFDTGFVCHCRGWDTLREEDCGILWEHLVLESLLAHIGPRKLHYWRDKQKREVDFVIPGPRGMCDAIECEWDPSHLCLRGLKAFREAYPRGRNFVISPHVGEPLSEERGGLELTFCSIGQWAAAMSTP